MSRGWGWRQAVAAGCPLLCLMGLSCRSLPAPPPVREVVAWEIVPAEGYRDEASYVTLEYASPESLRAAASSGIPGGGRLTVHLGYRTLADANTAWFRFEAFEGLRVLLRCAGEQGVPNVKGLDGYWWNDVPLDIPEPVTAEARVVVHNRKYGVTYVFNLRKIVRREPERGDS